MEELRSHTQSERRERAKAALHVSENIAQEREGLVQQLNFMKNLNTKMLDERDTEEVESRKSSTNQGPQAWMLLWGAAF